MSSQRNQLTSKEPHPQTLAVPQVTRMPLGARDNVGRITRGCLAYDGNRDGNDGSRERSAAVVNNQVPSQSLT